MSRTATIGNYTVGGGRPLLIVGPCVIESADLTLAIAESILKTPSASRFDIVFKASYRKDNRSSGKSDTGPGIDEGLSVLARVKQESGLPVLSDIHHPEEAAAAAEVLDVLQIPAFLCRQTSLLVAAARTGRPVNVKKGQFMAPQDMRNVADKLRGSGAKNILITERGTTFGYHNLVVDFRGFAHMRDAGAPVIFDVTHSLQKPGAQGTASGGEPELAAEMARAGAAFGVDGFFIETHPDPKNAKSDAASMLPLSELESLLNGVARVWELTKELTRS